MQMFKKFFGYLESVKVEMGKVTWPTRAEVIESAKIVLVMTVILAAAVFVVDRALAYGLELIL
jgi:preprotein translocase subunit SecE